MSAFDSPLEESESEYFSSQLCFIQSQLRIGSQPSIFTFTGVAAGQYGLNLEKDVYQFLNEYSPVVVVRSNNLINIF